jgi:hypothetical protein
MRRCRGTGADGSWVGHRDTRGGPGSGAGRPRNPRGRRLGRRHPFGLVGQSLSPRSGEQVLRPARGRANRNHGRLSFPWVSTSQVTTLLQAMSAGEDGQ